MITYSVKGDILYIRLSEAKVRHTKTLDDACIVDLDADNRVCGIEIIGASAAFPEAMLDVVDERIDEVVPMGED